MPLTLLSAAQAALRKLPFNDVSAVCITGTNSKLTLIINIYNPCDKSIISELHEYLQSRLSTQN
jgi:hypothetical protein